MLTPYSQLRRYIPRYVRKVFEMKAMGRWNNSKAKQVKTAMI